MYFIKKVNSEPTMPDFDRHLSSDLSTINVCVKFTLYSQVQKMSHSGMTSPDLALRQDKTYIHMYLVYTCNVFY